MQTYFYILFSILRVTLIPALPGTAPAGTFYPTELLVGAPFTLKSVLKKVQTIYFMAMLALIKLKIFKSLA